jgi:hypothetical protein
VRRTILQSVSSAALLGAAVLLVWFAQDDATISPPIRAGQATSVAEPPATAVLPDGGEPGPARFEIGGTRAGHGPAAAEVRVLWPDRTGAAGVRVQLQRLTSPGSGHRTVATTIAGGIARFEALAATRYAATSERGGWATFSHSVDAPGRAELRLMDALFVDGRVLDPFGAPVEGAIIWQSDPALEPKRVAQSDPDGRFQAAEVRTGVRLIATAARYAPTAAVTTIDRGGRTDAPLLQFSMPGAELRVEACLATGAPIAGAQVRLLPIDLGSVDAFASRIAIGSMTTDAGGATAFECLLPGRYRLVVDASELALSTREVTIDAGSSRSIRVQLGPGAPLHVRVREADGSQARPVRVTALLPSGERVEAVPELGDRLRFDRLPAGRIELTAWRTTLSTNATLDFDAESPRTLELRLPRCAEVSGRIVDATGAPLAGWQIRLELLDGSTSGTATSASDGTFTIERCPIQPHRLWSLDPAAPAAGPAIAPIVPGGAPLLVRIDRAGPAGGSLRLRVRDADGGVIRPLVTLRAQRGFGSSQVALLEVAADSYQFRGLSAGDYEIQIAMPDRGVLPIPVTIRSDGDAVDLGTVLVPKPAALWVRVSPFEPTAMIELRAGRMLRRVEAEGTVRVAPLVPGSWRVALTGPGIATRELPVELAPGQERTLELHAERGWPVTIRFGDGTPSATTFRIAIQDSASELVAERVQLGATELRLYLRAGDHSVAVTSSDGRSGTASLHLPDGAAEPVICALELR